MQAPENGKALTNLAQSFSNALSRVLSDLSEKTWKTSIAENTPAALPDDAGAMYVKFTLAGSLDGEAVLTLRKSDLTQLQVRGTKDEDVAQAERESALVSAFQASAAIWSQAFAGYGSVSVQVQVSDDASTVKDHLLGLSAQADGAGAPVSMALTFSSRLVSSAQSAAAKTLAYPMAEPSANLDLVLDVELNVTLRFGQRQLSLREVLDLTSGSVVELDRQVDEPVELVLDGRIVARGEAVIIDGVYGMRITQVLQPLVA